MENIIRKIKNEKSEKKRKPNRNEEGNKKDLKVTVIYESQGRSKRNPRRRKKIKAVKQNK